MKMGWQKKTLGEICDIERGGSPRPIQEFITTDPNGINWIKIGDATASGKYIYKTEEKIKPEGVKRSRMVYEGDFILSNSMSFGRPYIMKTTGCIHDGWLVLHQPKVDPDYLYHALSSDLVFDQFDRLAAGSTVRNLNIGLAKSVEIPYPPLPEQRRIVGILDEAFAGLATARANAEKNLQNARALFESHLQSVFTQRGKGWVETRLEDVCGLQNGFAFKSSTFKPSGAPILRISNIQDGRIDAGNRLVFFDPKDYRENLDRYRIVEDDLLIAMSGATTGKLGFNTESTVYYLNQRVGKFEPSERLNKRFLYHFLSTKVEENLRISAGAAQPNLSTEQIKGFVLPLPSVDEQERIVEALEVLSEETQRLARLYERKLAALAALKKSLLHQAFSGEL